jgi:hypothetical protein
MSRYYSKQKFERKNEIFPKENEYYPRRRMETPKYYDYSRDMYQYAQIKSGYKTLKKLNYYDFDRYDPRETHADYQYLQKKLHKYKPHKKQYEKKNLNYEVIDKKFLSSKYLGSKESSFYFKNGFIADSSSMRKNAVRNQNKRKFKINPENRLNQRRRAEYGYFENQREFDSFKRSSLDPNNEELNWEQINFQKNKINNFRNKNSYRRPFLKEFNSSEDKLNYENFNNLKQKKDNLPKLSKRSYFEFFNYNRQISENFGFEMCYPSYRNPQDNWKFENKISEVDVIQEKCFDVYHQNKARNFRKSERSKENTVEQLEKLKKIYLRHSKDPKKNLILTIMNLKNNDFKSNLKSNKKSSQSFKINDHNPSYKNQFEKKYEPKANESEVTHEHEGNNNFEYAKKTYESETNEKPNNSLKKNSNKKIQNSDQKHKLGEITFKRRSIRLMNKRRFTVSNKYKSEDENIINSQSKSSIKKTPSTQSKKKTKKKYKKKTKIEKCDEVSLFSDPESEEESSSASESKYFRMSLRNKKGNSNQDLQKKRKEASTYVNIRQIRKGSFLYKKFSKYFAIPLEEVIHNDDIFDDIKSNLSDDKKYADLSKLNGPSPFSSYYNSKQKKVTFELEPSDDNKTDKEIKSFTKKIRKNGKLISEIKKKFNFVCSQDDIKNLIIRFKGLKRLKELILNCDQELKEFILDLVQ